MPLAQTDDWYDDPVESMRMNLRIERLVEEADSILNDVPSPHPDLLLIRAPEDDGYESITLIYARGPLAEVLADTVEKFGDVVSSQDD